MVEGHVPQGVWVQVPPSASDGRHMAAFCIHCISRKILPEIISVKAKLRESQIVIKIALCGKMHKDFWK
jgi:hypothetical protein